MNDNALILYSSANVSKNDAKGAFIPEAKAFKKHLERFKDEELRFKVYSNPINCKRLAGYRRGSVEQAFSIHGERSLSVIAMFCHGYPSGIQFGYDFRNVCNLADVIEEKATSDVLVVLYACSTASSSYKKYTKNSTVLENAPGTDGGFADMLRDLLCRRGLVNCRVVAHKTAGHTTRNPFVVFFDGDGTEEGLTEDAYNGGYYPVEPFDGRMWRAWISALKTDFRFEFPFLTEDEIHAKLLSR